MSGQSFERFQDQLDEILSMVIKMETKIDNMAGSRQNGRTCFTVNEAAKELGKTPYTVRQWCLEGRINATKREERRGGSEVWSISAEEILRYKNEGLLPRPARPRCA